MKKLIVNSRMIKIATSLCWLYVPEHTDIFSLAEAKPLPIGCHCAGRQGLASRFWTRPAGLCEGMTANNIYVFHPIQLSNIK